MNRRASTNDSNPFCARQIRPGAVPYLFSHGEDAATLVERLRCSDWWGQIIGAHGTGKSALLAALIPAIEDAGRKVVLVELHNGQRRLPLDLRSEQQHLRGGLLIIDGYEQLSRWSRFRLKRFCRLQGGGLLVTAHASVGLPTICSTAITEEMAEGIVRGFLAGRDALVSCSDVRECFQRQQGNFRETLFDLYDLCEQRRLSAVSNQGGIGLEAEKDPRNGQVRPKL